MPHEPAAGSGKKRLRLALLWRAGKVCSGGCPVGCVGLTVADGFSIDCPACGGRDAKCTVCGGKDGQLEIIGCPLRIAGSDAFLLLEAAEDYDRGIPPIAGGRNEQAQIFLDAVRFIRGDREELERPESDNEDALLMALLKRR